MGKEVKSEKETPYRILCPCCGPICLSKEEYDRQMWQFNKLWSCPVCREVAEWDDDWYEEHEELFEDQEDAKERFDRDVIKCVEPENE